ncbi:mttA/Hcf106 family protein [Ehrlichia chaffeensis str. Liberty]|uniref:Sec-independent protein translocase protein TatB n=1 Tax=Ehrlichia chaffeensis (strain ATCC CRL-10679 / Arkansas) TaxID=205920 RepID=Q2GG63_EHRCR|nr:twin-arginine translocase TatA/TatE family subunit [Ehrlichia chaffeensis]ABD45588.1 hypothetical protein ECH_0772 [Ehrlichia chaffeensis str. Arkansas]AHX05445.1 mttA/Hcf106 family protein [Ehrlichia chaffeensis str. Jax]AHX06433.1 mttA/Hcf106 family protein [Ehrlichia chaffeensis str. Liberty]AHX08015.1 mttA/Hcf106 family protein [Ehrlichia chaffeensis str. Osceola]
MFSVGISEIIVIILVVCLVIDPKKLPFLAKNLGVYYKKFIDTKGEVLNYFNKFYMDCIEEQNDKVTIKEIVGNDGKVYKSYEIKKISSKKEDI